MGEGVESTKVLGSGRVGNTLQEGSDNGVELDDGGEFQMFLE